MSDQHPTSDQPPGDPLEAMLTDAALWEDPLEGLEDQIMAAIAEEVAASPDLRVIDDGPVV